MARTSEIISLIQNLTEEQLDRLKRFILTKLNFMSVATTSIRTHDCPHCGSMDNHASPFPLERLQLNHKTHLYIIYLEQSQSKESLAQAMFRRHQMKYN